MKENISTILEIGFFTIGMSLFILLILLIFWFDDIMKIQLNHKTSVTVANNPLIRHKYKISIKGCPLYPYAFHDTRADLINCLKHSFDIRHLEEVIPWETMFIMQ